MPSETTKASVVVRNATLDDVPAIAALVLKVYAGDGALIASGH